MQRIASLPTQSNPQFLATTKPATNGKPCACSASDIIGGQCNHREGYRQRARLVWLLRDETWQTVEEALTTWHHNRQLTGHRQRAGDWQKILWDARKLYKQYRLSDRALPSSTRTVWRALTCVDGWALLKLAAQANVASKAHFFEASFRLMRLYKSLACSPGTNLNGVMPISKNLLTKKAHGLGLGWRRAQTYFREWRRLRLLAIARPATKANRKAHLCRTCKVNFHFESRFGGNPPRVVREVIEVASFEEFIGALARGEYEPNGKRVRLRGLISLLGDSRRLRSAWHKGIKRVSPSVCKAGLRA